MASPSQPSADRVPTGRHHLGVHPHQWRPFRALPGPSLRRHAFPDHGGAPTRRKWWTAS